jgi:hypothetical protein
MNKKVTMKDLFDAFIKLNHPTEEKVVISVSAYEKAYDVFDDIKVLINPTDEDIEEEFNGNFPGDNDDWEYGIYSKGERIG